MSVSGLSMGSLGMNMGLRGRENQKDGTYRNQVWKEFELVSDKHISWIEWWYLTHRRTFSVSFRATLGKSTHGRL